MRRNIKLKIQRLIIYHRSIFIGRILMLISIDRMRGKTADFRVGQNSRF